MSRCPSVLLRHSRLVFVMLVLALGGLATFLLPGSPAQPAGQGESSEKLEIRPGDHISLVGNTLAERMQHDGWLETYLYSRFPRHNLVFRNLGFSGDELTLRLR